jgi:hypothetical protein
MNLPFTLPDWLPDWAFLLLAIPALLFVLAFLVMPFSVFGVKARLEAMEAQLDAVAEELRNLNFRARGVTGRGFADDGGRGFADDGEPFDLPNFGRQKIPQPSFEDRRPVPPVPPPIIPPAESRDRQPGPRLPQRPPRRTEPRLD